MLAIFDGSSAPVSISRMPAAPAARAPAASRPSATMRAAAASGESRSTERPARAERPGIESMTSFSTRKCASCGANVEKTAVCVECGWHKYEGERECPTCHGKVHISLFPAPREKAGRAVMNAVSVLGFVAALATGAPGFGVLFFAVAVMVAAPAPLLRMRCTKCAAEVELEKLTAREQASVHGFRRAMRTAGLVFVGLSLFSVAMMFRKTTVELAVGRTLVVHATVPGGQSTKREDTTLPGTGKVQGTILTSTGGFTSVRMVLVAAFDASRPTEGDVEPAMKAVMTSAGVSSDQAPVTTVTDGMRIVERSFSGRTSDGAVWGKLRGYLSGTAIIVIGAATQSEDGPDSPAVAATLDSAKKN